MYLPGTSQHLNYSSATDSLLLSSLYSQSQKGMAKFKSSLKNNPRNMFDPVSSLVFVRHEKYFILRIKYNKIVLQPQCSELYEI